MQLSPETLYIIQLIGVVTAGGFIGEFYRSSSTPLPIKVFIGKFLAGSFLSWLIAYIISFIIDKKNITIAIGGILSFQDIKFLEKFSKKMLLNMLKESDDK